MTHLSSQLADARGQSIAILESLPEEYINQKRDENTWSIAQVLDHLALIDNSIARLFQHTDPQSAHYVEVERPLHRIVDRSTRIQAPEYLRPLHTVWSKLELKQHLTEARETLVNAIQPFGDESTLARIAPDREHPVFGVLSLRQWIQFIAEHELRHVEQMKEIIGSTPHA